MLFCRLLLFNNFFSSSQFLFHYRPATVFSLTNELAPFVDFAATGVVSKYATEGGRIAKPEVSRREQG